MKKALLAIALAAFAIIAVFGAWDALASGDGNMPGCLATSLNGFQCPSVPGTLDYLNFHVKAFTGFSSSSIAAALFSLALIALGLAHLAATSLFGVLRLSRPRVSERASDRAYVPLYERMVTSWLSLLENSPATSKGA